MAETLFRSTIDLIMNIPATPLCSAILMLIHTVSIEARDRNGIYPRRRPDLDVNFSLPHRCAMLEDDFMQVRANLFDRLWKIRNMEKNDHFGI
jgi:hypothetical protein